MSCVVCHSPDIAMRRVNKQLARGEDVILVPVDVLVCNNCGERYCDCRTMRRLEEIEDAIGAGRVSLERVGEVLRQGINRLLADIYGRSYLLSDILRRRGVSQADIARIHEQRLADFLDELLAVWRAAFAGELVQGGWHVITRSYGLDGNAPAPTKRLAQELAVSRQVIMGIRSQTLRALRAPTSRGRLESMAEAAGDSGESGGVELSTIADWRGGWGRLWLLFRQR